MALEERYGSREACLQAQAMIDISFEHLNGLRTTCLADNHITQKEIRTLEVSSRFRSWPLLSTESADDCQTGHLQSLPSRSPLTRSLLGC